MTADALYAALLKETVEAGETRVTHHADGMATWTFSPAWDPPEHPFPALPENGRLEMKMIPMWAARRPPIWQFSVEDLDAGVTTSLTREEFFDLYQRLSERAANAEGGQR